MSIENETERTRVESEIKMGRERVPWNRVLLVVVVLAMVAAFCAFYYTRCFAGGIDREAEDIAQVARNISEGKGFTTRVIRPFNLWFQQPHDQGMPELNHGPLVPYVMAGMFGLRGVSDQAAVWTSLVFLLLTVGATYLLGSLLFDWRAGLLAAVVTGVSAPIIEVGISAEEWTMAALWFTLLLCAVALHHRSVLEQSRRTQMVYAGLAALLAALLYSTNYVFILLALPLLVYFVLMGRNRARQSVVFAVVFALAVSPLVYRNTIYTGSPALGASTWDIMANTDEYPANTLYRSTTAERPGVWTAVLFPAQHFSAFSKKLVTGTNALVTTGVGMLGWLVLPFAVVSAFYRFKQPTANCVRGFLYGAGVLMLAGFALFSVGTGVVLLFAPAAAVFASAYLILLLEAKKLHPEYAKGLVAGLLIVTALPAVGVMVWKDTERERKSVAVADQFFGANAERMRADLAMYTDVPWVAAWRTRSAGVWLPTSDDDIYRLAEHGMPMTAVILTPESENYSPDEVWYVLHRVRMWRRYVEDPDKGLKEILAESSTSEGQQKNAESFFKRVNRNFAVSETIAGFQTKTIDPLAPDDIQVFLPPGSE